LLCLAQRVLRAQPVAKGQVATREAQAILVLLVLRAAKEIQVKLVQAAGQQSLLYQLKRLQQNKVRTIYFKLKIRRIS
jgi:hypothetical protein